jgi:hypothetical protein
VQHQLGHAAGKEETDGRMADGAVGQHVDQAGHAEIDAVPILDRRPPQPRLEGDGRDVQQEVRRAAAGRVHGERVLDGIVGQNMTSRQLFLGQGHDRAGRLPRRGQPDRLPGRGQCRVGQRESERLGHDLRGRRGPQKLAAATRRSTRAATHVGGVLERDVPFGEARPDRLNLACVFSIGGGQRDATRDDHGRQIVLGGQRHHCRRQTLVTGGDADHAFPQRQRADQPFEHDGRVVPIRQTVHHGRRPLRTAVARIAHRRGKGETLEPVKLLRSRLDEQPDFPVSGVVAQRDRPAVLGSQAPLRADDEHLIAEELLRVPAHSGALRHAEQVAAGAVAQQLVGERQPPGWPGRPCLNVEEVAITIEERLEHNSHMAVIIPMTISFESRQLLCENNRLAGFFTVQFRGGIGILSVHAATDDRSHKATDHYVKRSLRVTIMIGTRLAILMLTFAALPCATGAFAAEGNSLVELAEARFGRVESDGCRHLNPVDFELFSKTEVGAIAKFPLPPSAPRSNPALFLPASRRTVLADRLLWLLTDPDALSQVTENGVQISGAFLARSATEPAIDFSRIQIPFPIALSECGLSSQLILHHCELRALDLSGSHIAGLFADGIKVDGDVSLLNGFQSSRPLLFKDASIGKRLQCHGAHLDQGSSTPPSWLRVKGSASSSTIQEPTLDMRNATVKGNVMLGEGFYCRGDILLSGATIDGAVDCNKGEVALEHGFECDGQFDLTGTTIKSDLMCDGALFTNPRKSAVCLELATVNGNAHFHHATCRGALQLLNASIRGSLVFDRGSFENHNGAALSMSGIHVNGDLFLRSVICRGTVDLFRATVGSEIEIVDSALDGSGDFALILWLADVNGDLLLRHTRCHGVVRLSHASLRGSLKCEDTQIDNAQIWLPSDATGGRVPVFYWLGYSEVRELALWMEGIHVGGELHLTGCKCNGAIYLLGATIGSLVDCRGSVFNSPHSVALLMVSADVKGIVELSGSTYHGMVDLRESTIRGSLMCQRTTFDEGETGQPVLQLRGSTVNGDVDERDAHFHGAVDLAEATIRGSLFFDGAQLDKGDAAKGGVLSLQHTQVHGAVSLGKSEAAPFHSQGCVNFYGATIDKVVDCTGCKCDNANKIALTFEQAEIKGNLVLKHATCNGEVRLRNATIHGNLDCDDGATFINLMPNQTALRCDGMRLGGSAVFQGKTRIEGTLSLVGASVERSFVCKDLQSADKLFIDLRSAQVGSLDDGPLDDVCNDWPTFRGLRLDEFKYGELAQGAPDDAERRVKWLHLQKAENEKAVSLSMQPYSELASVLRKQGYDGAARKVLIQKEIDSVDPDRSNVQFLTRMMNFCYRITVGYGYTPWLAGLWAIAMVLIGGFVFWRARAKSMMRRVKANAPPFSPWIYSLETLIPLIKLEQQEYWIPDAKSPYCFNVWKFRVTGTFLRRYQWAHIMCGWVLAAALLAGLSGLLHTP